MVRGETPWTVVPAPSAGGSAINITKAMNREKVARLVRGVMGLNAGSLLFLVPATMGFNGRCGIP